MPARMDRCLFFMLLAGVCAMGCAAPSTYATADYKVSPGDKAMTFIPVEDNPKRGYLIDPATETCTLVYELYANVASAVAVPVDCAKLARHNAHAADRITWLAPAAAPAGPTPAPEPPPVQP